MRLSLGRKAFLPSSLLGSQGSTAADAEHPRDEDFVAFAERQSDRLSGIAYLLCGNWHTAEDLAQSVLVKMYLAWPRLARRGELDGYARQALLRAYLDLRRRSSSSELPVEDVIIAVDDGGVGVESRLLLVNALGVLTPIQRSVLVLRYWEDLDVASVSSILAMPEATVRSHSKRGLAVLRAELARRGLSTYLEVSAE